MTEYHPHQIARANVVLAALFLLTKGQVDGFVRGDSPYRPEADLDDLVFLEAATAMQTELSLSIDASDPLLSDAAHELVRRFRPGVYGQNAEETIVEIDNEIHELIDLLDGRGASLAAAAEWLYESGEVSLSDLAAKLGIATST